jgi:hypothetical protein
MKSNYSLAYCEELIDRYVNTYGGECTTIVEGCLGLGTVLLHWAEGKKTILIKEYYINAWNSGHSVRCYNKMPKKYERILDVMR